MVKDLSLCLTMAKRMTVLDGDNPLLKAPNLVIVELNQPVGRRAQQLH